MRRFLLAVCAGAACLVAPAPARAWEIRDYDVRLTVHADSTLDVEERITADFTGESRHGIYRDIPVIYRDRFGQRVNARVTEIAVADAAGRAQPFTAQRQGALQHILIGDPDRTVTGLQTYHIRYRVARALGFFPDHDELYWNAIGTEWAAPIGQASATVELPWGVSSNVRAAVFTGAYGGRAGDADVSQPTPHTVRFSATRSFQPYEGLTVVVGWPKGIVQPPSFAQQLRWWLADNWPYGIPLVVAALMGWLWWTRGRDPRLTRSIAVRYEPPNDLSPAEMGALVDDRVDLRDITATIVDLAVRGHLTIEATENRGLWSAPGCALTLQKPLGPEAGLKDHECKVLRGLFQQRGPTNVSAGRVTLDNLEHTFYAELPGICNSVYESLRARGFIVGNPITVRLRYYSVAGALMFGAFFLLSWGIAWCIALLASAALVAGFGHWMPRKTHRGVEALAETLGFEEFLTRTEQDRLDRLALTPQFFERLLPYALALGLAAALAKKFAGIMLPPPQWFVGGSGTWDSPLSFTRQLERTSGSLGRTLSSAPRSSSFSSGSSGFGGGGSSGGGGGGGGGGAW